VAKNLVDNWLKEYKLEVIGYGSKSRIEGHSGYKHQIDVACKDSKNPRIVLFECKHYKSKIELQDVLILYSRIVDIQHKAKITTEGVMITTVGYTKNARKFANAYGIKLGKVENDSEFGVFIGNLGFLGVMDTGRAIDNVYIKVVQAEMRT